MWKKITTATVSAMLLSVSASVLATAPAQAAAAPVPQGWKITAGGMLRITTGAPNQTVTANLTVTEPEGAGYVTAWPCTSQKPLASTINYTTGRTVANGTVVKSDENGEVCFYSTSAAHILWDQTGDITDVATSTSPVRKIDTRNPGQTKPTSGAVVKVQTGIANRPIVGNLTVTQPDGAGYATMYPCAAGRPATSSINYTTAQTVANGVIVKSDQNGEVCIYTPVPTHLIWDQTGYLTPRTVQYGGFSVSSPVVNNPTRILDTRSGGAKPGRGSVTKIHTSVPNTAVLGNLTVTQPDDYGYVTAYPCAEWPPEASNINYIVGKTVANNVIVKTNQNGDFCVYTTSPTHLIWDQAGDFRNVGNIDLPVRLLDSRELNMPKNPADGKDFPESVDRWAPYAYATLANLKINGRYLPGVLAQIQRSSSGDPAKVNDYDANWQKGVAAFGLMQINYPNFKTYTAARPECQQPLQMLTVRGIPQQYSPSMKDKLDGTTPCNIYAGVNYATTIYGLARLDAWNRGDNTPS